MGLDIVELVMEIEETFGIRIEDDDAERMRTVGDVYRYIQLSIADGRARFPKTPRECVCLSAVTFYRIRRALMTVLGTARNAVRPGTPLVDLLPRRERRKAWAAIAESAQLVLPPLVRPVWLVWALTAIVLLAAAGGAYAASLVLPAWAAVGLEFALLLPLAVLAVRLSRPLATLTGKHASTVRNLTWCVAGANLVSLQQQYGSPSDSEVWEVLKMVIVRQLGVAPEAVTPEARFVEDFRCD